MATSDAPLNVPNVTLAVARGSAAPAGISFSDSFEGALAANTQFFQWADAVRTSISTDRATEGSSSLKFFFPGSANVSGEPGDAWAEQRFSLGGIYKEVWISYKLYVPLNYYHRDGVGSDNNKGWFILWSGTYGATNVLIASSWWPEVDGSNAFAGTGSTRMAGNWKNNGNDFSEHFFTDDRGVTDALAIDVNNDLGKWMDFTCQIVVADQNQSNGVYKIWKNGSLLYSAENIANWGNDPDTSLNGIEKGYLLGYANSGFNEDTSMYIDEFKIGTTAESIGAGALV